MDRHSKSLAAKDLEKVIKGRRVVRSVSLTVESNEIVGLLGPNGAGENNSVWNDCRLGHT